MSEYDVAQLIKDKINEQDISQLIKDNLKYLITEDAEVRTIVKEIVREYIVDRLSTFDVNLKL